MEKNNAGPTSDLPASISPTVSLFLKPLSLDADMKAAENFSTTKCAECLKEEYVNHLVPILFSKCVPCLYFFVLIFI